MREPLRHRSFRLLFLAQCASFLGDAVFIVAIAFAVLEVAGTATALGGVLAVGSALLVASYVVSGVWADRVPRLRLMVASDLVRLLTQGTLAVLLLTDTATLPWLFALYGLYSIATAFFTPARAALTPQLLDGRLLLAGNGLMATAENVMWALGWAAGGLLVAWLGVGWTIALDAASFAVSAVLLLCIGHVPRPEGGGDRQSFLRELRDGWGEVSSRRWLWFIIAGATLFLMLYEAPMQVVGPLLMEAEHDGAASWGLLLAAMAVGSTVGAVLVASHRIRRPMLLSIVLFFATAVQPVLLLVGAPFGVLLVGNAVVGLGFGLFDTVWNSALQHRIPEHRIARVSAWDWMGSLAGMPIGFALAGVLVEGTGRDTTLAAIAVGALLVCIGFTLDREVRSLGDDLVLQARAERAAGKPGA